jgi:hypothetical protein
MNSRTKQKILEKYLLLIKEFFILLNESNVMKNLNYPKISIKIGLQSIHRVFEYIFSKTQNIDSAYFYAQKTYYYYLEYMEQIHESNFSLNLNHIDAVLFVYKKTIIEFQDKNDENTSSVTNIMSLHHDNKATLDTKELVKLFQKLCKMVNILFFWNHPTFDFECLRNMYDLFFIRFIQKIDKIGELTFPFIELVQEKTIDISFEKYKEFLNELIDRIEKNIIVEKLVKKTDLMDSNYLEMKKNNIFLEKYYTNQDEFLQKFQEEKIGDFIHWMYS